MRTTTILGSLLLSVVLCGPGFGGELAARILGLETCADRDCGVCAPCEPACQTCEPAQCCGPTLREKLCRLPGVCKMLACAPACAAPCCEEADCDVGCEADCTPRRTPVRDLLNDIRVTLFCKRCLTDCCETDCCEADCSGGCGYSTISDNSTAPAPAPIQAAPTPAPDAPVPAPVPKTVPVPDAAPIPPAPSA